MDAAPGTSPFDHHVYAFCSDGDIEEGITHESSAIAAVQELGNLIVLYDDNYISIEDDTAIAKSEDTLARYAAYGWHTQRVSFRTPDGTIASPSGTREKPSVTTTASPSAGGSNRKISLLLYSEWIISCSS